MTTLARRRRALAAIKSKQVGKLLIEVFGDHSDDFLEAIYTYPSASRMRFFDTMIPRIEKPSGIKLVKGN